MKTKLTFLAFLVCSIAFAQIPSINQTKVKAQSYSFSTIMDTKTIQPIDNNEITPIIKDVDTLKQSISIVIPTVPPIDTKSLTIDNKELLKRIAKQNSGIKAQSLMIERQSSEIKKQKLKIEEHNLKITEQNDKIDTLNNQITNQKQAIDNQNTAIQEQNKKIEALKEKTEEEEIFEAESYILKYDDLIKKKKEQIKKKMYEQRSKETDAEMDSVEIEITKLEDDLQKLKIKKDKKVKEKSYNWWMPSCGKDKKQDYFFYTMYNSKDSKTKFLNSFGINGSEFGVSGQSELITDNIAAFRLAFGTVITASNNDEELTQEDETAIEALDRLVNGGGNFYLETILPLMTTIDRNNSDVITAYSYFSVRAATDIKGYGNDIDTSTGNGSAGLYLYLGFSSENRKFNFFFQGNANYTMGSKDFYRNLSVDHNNGFFNGKLIAGLTLDNKFRFTANFLTYGSEQSLRREKIALGFQFLP